MDQAECVFSWWDWAFFPECYWGNILVSIYMLMVLGIELTLRRFGWRAESLSWENICIKLSAYPWPLLLWPCKFEKIFASSCCPPHCASPLPLLLWPCNALLTFAARATFGCAWKVGFDYHVLVSGVHTTSNKWLVYFLTIFSCKCSIEGLGLSPADHLLSIKVSPWAMGNHYSEFRKINFMKTSFCEGTQCSSLSK